MGAFIRVSSVIGVGILLSSIALIGVLLVIIAVGYIVWLGLGMLIPISFTIIGMWANGDALLHSDDDADTEENFIGMLIFGIITILMLIYFVYSWIRPNPNWQPNPSFLSYFFGM